MKQGELTSIIESFNGSLSHQYNGEEIYYNEHTGQWYIYTGDKGQGRVDFSTDKEAEEYIDNMNNEDIQRYLVFYINTIDKTDSMSVNAVSKQEAKYIAKEELGDECTQIIDVQQV